MVIHTCAGMLSFIGAVSMTIQLANGFTPFAPTGQLALR
jgi:hypothetical protein